MNLFPVEDSKIDIGKVSESKSHLSECSLSWERI